MPAWYPSGLEEDAARMQKSIKCWRKTGISTTGGGGGKSPAKLKSYSSFPSRLQLIPRVKAGGGGQEELLLKGELSPEVKDFGFPLQQFNIALF